MRTVVVIPTYWGREKEIGFKEGDIVYDHATPVDEEGTLGRTLESMKILKKKDFKLVILICLTHKEIEHQAEEKVRKIVKGVKLEVETYLFTQMTLKKIKRFGRNSQLKENVLSLLSLEGYANVRNMCIFSSHILNSDITVLIDDDEVIENPDFMDIAREFIGKRVYGETVYGVAGYYLNKYGNYYDDVNMEPWMTYWNRFGSKSKAFDKIIGCGPRLKQTPFAFGGAMVIHKNLYQTVPFDPNIPRGEDIDYLINAKMFGFDFFLDNKLSIKHLPPKQNHPIWKRTREDIYRFIYEKIGLKDKKEILMRMIEFKDFSEEELEKIVQISAVKAYKEDELIFKEGDEDSSFYIIIRGCLRIIKYNERNEEIILADICSGEFLGETAIVNERHRVNAVASEFVELLSLEQKNLELLIKEDPKLGNKCLLVFLEKLSKKLDKTNRLFQENYILGNSSLSDLSLIHISEPTRLGMISYAVFCLKKKKKKIKIIVKRIHINRIIIEQYNKIKMI